MDVNFYHAPAGRRWRAGVLPRWGFTLIELLITVAVLSVLLAITLPSFAKLIADTRMVAAANSMAASLHLARSEAIKQAHDVVICKGGASTGCNKRHGWEAGWIVFVDEDANRRWDSATEQLLWVRQPLAAGSIVTLRAFPSANYFTYHPSGLAGSNGTFTFCDRRGADAARALIISRTGRPRSARTAADGSPLKCPAGA